MWKRILIIFMASVFIVCVAWLPQASADSSADVWTKRTPLPTGEYLQYVIFTNGTFTVAGNNGTLLTSADGISWTLQTSGTSNTLTGISYGGNIYVAVGLNGTIVTSSNGIDWSTRTSGTTANFSSVSYGNGTFVAVGASGLIMTSSDGLSWSPQTSTTDKGLTTVSYGNNLFVAVGASGTILTSGDNGVTWTPQTGGIMGQTQNVAFGGGLFMIAGNAGKIVTSADGVTWTPQTSGTTDQFEGASYANDTFMAFSYAYKTSTKTIWTSTNGTTWTQRDSGAMNQLRSASYGNGIYVAVGAYGRIVTSTDGASWTIRNSGTDSGSSDHLNGIGYGNNTFVAVGNARDIATSGDGIFWTSRTPSLSASAPFRSVAFGSSRFVAVGGGGFVITSTDNGVSWNTSSSNTANNLLSVSYGNNLFVAVGFSGTIITSPDGVTWTSRTSNTSSNLSGVIYANNMFVAVGASGAIVTSSNGVSWINQVSNSTTTLYSISYGNNTFVVGGQSGAILTSANGTDWTVQPKFSNTNVYGLTFGNGFFAGALGRATWYSFDGVSWKLGNANATSTLNGIYYANNQFVTVGENGLILQSNSFPLFSVTYDGNGNTGGSLPSVSKPYLDGDSFSVLGNSGTLTKTDYTFAGWNTKADGTGTSYAAWDNFNINAENVVLYAKWQLNGTYAVTYNGNGSSNGTVPLDNGTYTQGAAVAVAGNTGNLSKSGYTFAGWNTKANGTGTDYAAGATLNIVDANVVLYAKWTLNGAYTVTYHGNGSSNGTVPADSGTYTQGAAAAVAGNTGDLSKSGYTFAGWNTKADGTGTGYAAGGTFNIGAANVVLYAKWLLLGDANGDGMVTSADALLLTQYMKGKLTLTEDQKLALDVNGDHVWNELDVQLILAISVGKGAAG